MAIKFFFKPITQSVSQIITDLQRGTTTRADIVNYAKQYFQDNLMLPVNPQVLEITTTSDNKKTNVVKLGQIVIPKGVNLSTLTIESFFPSIKSVVNSLNDSRIPSYVLSTVGTLFSKFTPEQYLKYFETLQITQVPVRLVISECDVDMDVLVESIKKRYESQDEDLHYTLSLIEYKEHKAKQLVTKKTQAVVTSVSAKVVSVVKPRPKTGLAIGDTVIANGKYFYDSFGSKPYGTFKNFRGKISHMATNSKATNKYHITTLDGGWRGWVKADQLQGVD